MQTAKNGAWSIARCAMVIGIIATLGMRGAVAATPTMSAARTAHTLAAYWAALDAGVSPWSTVAADAVLTFGDTGQEFNGQAAVTSALNNLYHGAFAGRMTFADRIIGGGWEATSGTFIGTQTGSYDGLAATGNSVAVPYTAFYTVVNDKIATIRLDFSQQDILRQLAHPVVPWSSTPTRPGTPS